MVHNVRLFGIHTTGVLVGYSLHRLPIKQLLDLVTEIETKTKEMRRKQIDLSYGRTVEGNKIADY
jgi:hypothetical protein